MSIFFISDLHLHPSLSPLTEGFLTFLEKQAIHGEALYILGDLFEAWIGDDNITPFSQSISHGLEKLTHQGVPVYLMRGNRDFLMGKSFAQSCNAKLLPEFHLFSLYGEPTLLCHGDHLCTDDKKHQYFRRFSRHWLTQSFLYHTPLIWRKKMALRLRKLSGKHIKNKTILDVNEQAVLYTLKKWNTSQIIHGHTHRPGIHLLSENPKHRRIVLSDWKPLRGNALQYESDGTAKLIYF